MKTAAVVQATVHLVLLERRLETETKNTIYASHKTKKALRMSSNEI